MSTLGGGSFLDILLGGIKRVFRNGTPLPIRPAINLIGFQAVLDNPSLGSIDIFAASGGGSGGGSVLIIENNGSPMPVEPAANFIGFVLADNPGATRIDIWSSTGAPVVVSGSHTMQPGELWAIVHPGDSVAMPATRIVGQTIELTGVGLGFSFSPLTINGNGVNVESPDDRNNSDGNHAPASSVSATSENTTWRLRFDGTLWRCVN